MFLDLLLECLHCISSAAIQFLAFGRQHFSRPGWAISAACCPCSWHVAMWWVWDKMRNWMKLILADWDLFEKVFPQGQISSNSSRSKACSPNSWGNESKGHLGTGRWKDIFEFAIHMGLVDLTYTHWLHGIDWSNDDIYSCRVCLSCYQWSFTCSCCLNKTDSNTQQLTLRLNEKRSTVRPSDRQVLSSELNSALRSELQVLGALQALLNLIRLSRKEHTPLTPRLLTLHWHRRSWIFFWLMCKVLLSAWLQRSIHPTNLSSANWRNVLRTKTISVT